MKPIKSFLSPLAALALALILGSCAPAVESAKDAATAATNSVTCDALFTFEDPNLVFAPQGLVQDVYFTVTGEGVETKDLTPAEGFEGLFEKYYEGLIAGTITLEITRGEFVAVVTYERDETLRGCIAE